jgi:hypothetical protein
MVDVLSGASLRAALPLEACLGKPHGKIPRAHEACSRGMQTHHAGILHGGSLGLLPIHDLLLLDFELVPYCWPRSLHDWQYHVAIIPSPTRRGEAIVTTDAQRLQALHGQPHGGGQHKAPGLASEKARRAQKEVKLRLL